MKDLSVGVVYLIKLANTRHLFSGLCDVPGVRG